MRLIKFLPLIFVCISCAHTANSIIVVPEDREPSSVRGEKVIDDARAMGIMAYTCKFDIYLKKYMSSVPENPERSFSRVVFAETEKDAFKLALAGVRAQPLSQDNGKFLVGASPMDIPDLDFYIRDLNCTADEK